MYSSFNGEFRRKPEQNLSGASSKLSRHDIIQRAHLERQKREEQRLRLRSAIRVQAYVRSFQARQQFKKLQRDYFDELERNFKPNGNLDEILCTFLFFYNRSIDHAKLVWICQNILKQKNNILQSLSKNMVWRYRMQRLLNICVDALDTKHNNAIILRILDVFLSIKEDNLKSVNLTDLKWLTIIEKFFRFLTLNGYFNKMRSFLDQSFSFESNPTLSNEIVSFLLRPIQLIEQVDNDEYSDLIFEHFCKHLLSRQFSDPIKEVFITKLTEADFSRDKFYKYLVENQTKIEFSTFLFYCILKLISVESSNKKDIITPNLIKSLALLSDNIRKRSKFESQPLNDDDEWDMKDNDVDMMSNDEDVVLHESIVMLDNEILVQNIMRSLDDIDDSAIINYLGLLCFNMLMREEDAVQKHKLLYMLAFKPQFLRSLWGAEDNRRLLDGLLRGTHILNDTLMETCRVGGTVQTACRLTAFCELFNLLLTTLHDDEFSKGDLDSDTGKTAGKSMPFSLNELVNISSFMKQLAVGLVELTVTTPRVTPRTSYMKHTLQENDKNMKFWLALYKSCLKLITNLYQKDSRIQFCNENFWSKNTSISFTTDYHRIDQIAKVYVQVQSDDTPPLTTGEARILKILHDLPFLVPFSSRLLLFKALIMHVRQQHQDPERAAFLMGPSIGISVRRSHIYEDAYLKLQDADLRQKLRVQFVNAAGLEEPGIDGGGILREFLCDLLTTCFDPNRGYFKLNKENLLYPNPNVHRLVENYTRHYYFIGKMLGKALYENILVELPLAEFFLTKLVSQKFDVDFHYLASLDQDMYRNMLFLKNYDGNFEDLGLDFTIANEELGETQVDELKPNGANVMVTSTNKIEYIHLLADYKMNKQVRQQCLAFKQGLHSVLDLSYLQIFSNKELQLIISGADYEIDIQDLKEHTSYSGEHTAEHPTIKAFWEILEGFTSLQKRQLLKFVTSCSRPPLLGFKELQPSFCIQLSDARDRLPSASTCMNLLKIPQISDPEILKERLLYAISQSAGFELS